MELINKNAIIRKISSAIAHDEVVSARRILAMVESEKVAFDTDDIVNMFEEEKRKYFSHRDYGTMSGLSIATKIIREVENNK